MHSRRSNLVGECLRQVVIPLLFVYFCSRWSLNNMDNNDSSQLFPVMSGIGLHSMPHNGTQTDDIQNYLLRLVFFSQ